MDLNHKIKRQVNFTNLNTVPIPEIPFINRPVVLNNNFRHQKLGVSNASGLREIRVLTSKE